MKILILSMYDQLSASTRQRYSQFSIKALEKDIEFDIKSQRFYFGGKTPFTKVDELRKGYKSSSAD